LLAGYDSFSFQEQFDTQLSMNPHSINDLGQSPDALAQRVRMMDEQLANLQLVLARLDIGLTVI
jgi:hypothetical protein